MVDADLGLGRGDLRAAERTVQLLHQVAGAGRPRRGAGEVILQTYDPAHSGDAGLLAGDYAGSWRARRWKRRPGHWPPFGRLAALIVSADTAEAADSLARELGRLAPSMPGVVVLGPAPAPLALLRGRHRRRLLLKARRDVAVQPILRHWVAQVTPKGGQRIDVDVDPMSFL